ncbi:hypothetical protein LINGRAHAP2_LOCUS30357 [Linum grandiflorum]
MYSNFHPKNLRCPFIATLAAERATGLFMRCKVKDNYDLNDVEGFEVYDVLVLTNVELQVKENDLKEVIKMLEDRIDYI